MAELYELTIAEAGELLRSEKISSVELTRAHLERIRAVEDKVKAFTLITDELALQQAEEADRRIAGGKALAPLTGAQRALPPPVVRACWSTSSHRLMRRSWSS